MNKEALLTRIVVNPRVLVGKPTIRGLRISVEQILKALAAGVPVDDLLKDYPELEPEDIQAAIAYNKASVTGGERCHSEGILFQFSTVLDCNRMLPA
jgi:uncharacterized protein (DUF433 family)